MVQKRRIDKLNVVHV